MKFFRNTHDLGGKVRKNLPSPDSNTWIVHFLNHNVGKTLDEVTEEVFKYHRLFPEERNNDSFEVTRGKVAVGLIYAAEKNLAVVR